MLTIKQGTDGEISIKPRTSHNLPRFAMIWLRTVVNVHELLPLRRWLIPSSSGYSNTGSTRTLPDPQSLHMKKELFSVDIFARWLCVDPCCFSTPTVTGMKWSQWYLPSEFKEQEH